MKLYLGWPERSHMRALCRSQENLKLDPLLLCSPCCGSPLRLGLETKVPSKSSCREESTSSCCMCQACRGTNLCRSPSLRRLALHIL
eukprot:3745593-Amphidinium_carterae.1